MRRSARAWYDLDAGVSALSPAAEAMGQLLGWSAEERMRQVSACRVIHDNSMQFQKAGI